MGKAAEIEYHSTTLWTKRKGDFTCHWYRPCLDYEKGKMFEWGRKLHLEPHFCYEYLGRCSCMACMFMSDRHAVENMKRYPKQIQPFIQAEIRLLHTWKKGRAWRRYGNSARILMMWNRTGWLNLIESP